MEKQLENQLKDIAFELGKLWTEANSCAVAVDGGHLDNPELCAQGINDILTKISV